MKQIQASRNIFAMEILFRGKKKTQTLVNQPVRKKIFTPCSAERLIFNTLAKEIQSEVTVFQKQNLNPEWVPSY